MNTMQEFFSTPTMWIVMAALAVSGVIIGFAWTRDRAVAAVLGLGMPVVLVLAPLLGAVIGAGVGR